MSETIKKIGIPTLAVASALALAVLATSMVTPAFAAITPVTTDAGCTNGGGNSPGGQAANMLRFRINTTNRNREPKSIRRCATRTE